MSRHSPEPGVSGEFPENPWNQSELSPHKQEDTWAPVNEWGDANPSPIPLAPPTKSPSPPTISMSKPKFENNAIADKLFSGINIEVAAATPRERIYPEAILRDQKNATQFFNDLQRLAPKDDGVGIARWVDSNIQTWQKQIVQSWAGGSKETPTTNANRLFTWASSDEYAEKIKREYKIRKGLLEKDPSEKEVVVFVPGGSLVVNAKVSREVTEKLNRTIEKQANRFIRARIDKERKKLTEEMAHQITERRRRDKESYLMRLKANEEEYEKEGVIEKKQKTLFNFWGSKKKKEGDESDKREILFENENDDPPQSPRPQFFGTFFGKKAEEFDAPEQLGDESDSEKGDDDDDDDDDFTEFAAAPSEVPSEVPSGKASRESSQEPSHEMSATAEPIIQTVTMNTQSLSLSSSPLASSSHAPRFSITSQPVSHSSRPLSLASPPLTSSSQRPLSLASAPLSVKNTHSSSFASSTMSATNSTPDYSRQPMVAPLIASPPISMSSIPPVPKQRSQSPVTSINSGTLQPNRSGSRPQSMVVSKNWDMFDEFEAPSSTKTSHKFIPLPAQSSAKQNIADLMDIFPDTGLKQKQEDKKPFESDNLLDL